MDKPISWTYNEEFDKNGFFVIKKLCNPEFLYCKVPEENLKGKMLFYNLENKFYTVKEEDQVQGSISRFDFPDYSQAYHQIKLIMENFIGRKLNKTYYYDRFYFVNQELKKHQDRPECEISCTYHVSSNIKDSWDFKLISLTGEEKSISLSPGDALVYKGTELIHWRDPLKSKYNKFERIIRKILRKKDDTYYHQVFFHYVLQDGHFIQLATK